MKMKFIGAGLMVLLLLTAAACMSPQKKPEPPPAAAAEPEISVYMHETGETRRMKMEDYLAGVVAGEMRNDWPLQALAAQAIIARAFTLQAIEAGGVKGRDAQASTDIKEFQAYDAAAVNDRVREAVAMTRGVVAAYQGKPIKAWFHASAGGRTATAKEGLDYAEAEPPYVKSVQSPDDLAPADVQNWTAEFTLQEVLDALVKKGHDLMRIDKIEIGAKGPSGRAETIVFNGAVSVAAPELRLALGSTKLKSTLLNKVELDGDRVVFGGMGYGHGVGMSQWGAYKLAQEGKTAAEIVQYYFKDVTMEKRWE